VAVILVYESSFAVFLGVIFVLQLFKKKNKAWKLPVSKLLALDSAE